MPIPYRKRQPSFSKVHPLDGPGIRNLRPANQFSIDRPPTTQDFDTFQIGDEWIDRSSTAPKYHVYKLVRKFGTAHATKNATWVRFYGGAIGLETLTGDTGLAVPPDINDTIHINSGITGLSVDGNPATWALTLNSSDGGALLQSLRGDGGTQVYPVNAGYIDLLGTVNHIVTTEDVGNNRITWSLGAHIATTYTTDTGNAIPAVNVLNILGGGIATPLRNIHTTATGNTVRVECQNTITLGDLTPLGAGVNALSCTTGDVNIAAANLKLPRTTSTNSGVIKFAGSRYFHCYNAGATDNNLFIGKNSGNFTALAAATNNVCCGGNSLISLTSGSLNVAVSGGVLTNCTSGSNNTGCGDKALTSLTTGNYNSCYGSQAGLGCSGAASYNTCIGMDSLADSAHTHTGSYNVCIGVGSTGSTYVGAESSNILMTNIGVATENNTIRIGTHGAGARQQNKCFVAGIRGITTGVADAITVLIDSAHQLGTASSSIRFKENVRDLGEESELLYKLRPVTFNYISDDTKSKQYGLIAEEVIEHFPRLVVRDADGQIETVKYHELPSIMLNEIIKQHDTIKNLRTRLRILEEQVSLLLEKKIRE